jgi:hypothetical protein
MHRCCIVCKVEASPDLQLQYCAACQSALYCSEVCQRKDWRKQHKQICKLLNVGHGDMQVRAPIHTSRLIYLKERFERQERILDKDMKRFFKLFKESTEDGSWAAARKMKKIVKRKSPNNQKILLFHSLYLLIYSDSEMLSWPNSPLLVLLEFVDPSVLFGGGYAKFTPLHLLAELADTSDYSTHENQLILAKQLIEHGANVNAVSTPDSKTSLHTACSGGSVTNLDFIEILLKEGANPNSQCLGLTPLQRTIPFAPGAAKCLLKWPTTDINITTRVGVSFLANVRSIITEISDQSALPDDPDQVRHQFLLQQWREIEKMLMERAAHDTWFAAGCALL